MNAKVILTSALLLGALVPAVAVAASLPPVACVTAPGCPDPTGACTGPAFDPTQAVHSFVVASSFGATTDQGFNGAGVASVFDTSGCLDGDGDNETGQGGAQFPGYAEGSACDAPNGHHGDGVGATVTITSNTANLPVDYTASTDGTDPVAWTAGQTCTGNGVNADSFDTDPFDCGQGVTGHFPTGPSATVEANVNPHANTATDPNPWNSPPATNFGFVAQGSAYPAGPNGETCMGVSDGSVWAFLVFGAEVHGVNADLSGCPAPVGDGTGTPGGAGCGVTVGSVSAGVSTPVDGTIVDP